MNHVGLHCKRNKKHQRALISVMWIVYAAFASLCWGVSYAACGPLLKKGLNPLIFLLGYSLCGLIGSLIALLTSTKQSGEMSFADLSRADALWLIFSVAVSALGAYLTYAAMGAKNPSLVSLIEISYPLFVILFTWVFFREMQLNPVTCVGGLLVLAGVGVIILGER